MMKYRVFYFVMILLNMKAEIVSAAESHVSTRLNLFIDGGDINIDFVKSELKCVNFVRTRQDADVYLMITSQTNAENSSYELFFVGNNQFSCLVDSLKYTVKLIMTEDEKRSIFMRFLRIGLVRYLSHTNQVTGMDVTFEIDSSAIDTAVEIDQWKFWVFNINGNSSFNKERASLIGEYNFSFTANKTTEEMKIDFGASTGSGINEYYSSEGTITSRTSSKSIYGQYVKSINQHWSAGLFSGSGSSLYSNEKFHLSIAPALEYNLFPYSQCQRKLFTITWYIAYNYYDYFKTTLYEKSNENLIQNRMNISLNTIQPWGSIQFSISASHYFNDFSKNHLSFYSNTDLHIFKGLYLNLNIGYEIVHDQINLEKGSESQEELLLHRKEIATSYFLMFNTGITYSFGSKFSNVVNQRINGGY